MKTKLLLILIAARFLIAADGKLAGKITDQGTLQPLIGASVSIMDTTIGAATDMDGDYVIVGLHPGSYNLEIEYVGYKKVLKSNVIVRSGLTTVLNIDMAPDVLKGEGVEVVANYFTIPKESVISSRSMDYEEVRRAPGSNADIQRVVQALPSVVSGSDQMNEIIIRGGNPGENLFILDYIEIPNPNHFGIQGQGGGPINMLNTLMVENVDFYAGAFSAKYGGKASSVMDITQREGAKDAFHLNLDLGMAGAGGLLEGPIGGGKGSYMVSARKSFLDLIISNTGLTAVPHYYNLQGKVNWDFSPSQKLIFNAAYGNDHIRIEDQEEGNDGYSRGAENVYAKNQQSIFGSTLRSLWGKDMVSFLTLSTVSNTYDADVYHSKDHDTYFYNKSTERENMLKSEFSWQPNKEMTVDFGAKLKLSEFDHNLWSAVDTFFVYDPVSGDSLGFDPLRTRPEYIQKKNASTYKTASYVQFKYTILPDVEVHAGLRHEYFEYTDFQAFSPRFGITWQVTPKTRLSAAAGRHFQSPSYIELTANPLNKDLADRHADQVVLGVEQLFGSDTRMTFEVYHKQYSKVPVSIDLTTPDPYDYADGRYLDIGEGRSSGAEFYLHKKLTKHWSGIVSYSYSVAESKDLRYNKWIPSDYDYRHVFTLIGGYKWSTDGGDEYELSSKLRYLGGRPYTEPTYFPQYKRWIVTGDQDLNNKRYPYYLRFDIRLDMRYFFDSFNIVTYFDISNVFNRHNIWSYQYNTDGSITDVLQYEVFPVGGVILEF